MPAGGVRADVCGRGPAGVALTGTGLAPDALAGGSAVLPSRARDCSSALAGRVTRCYPRGHGTALDALAGGATLCPHGRGPSDTLAGGAAPAVPSRAGPLRCPHEGARRPRPRSAAARHVPEAVRRHADQARARSDAHTGAAGPEPAPARARARPARQPRAGQPVTLRVNTHAPPPHGRAPVPPDTHADNRHHTGSHTRPAPHSTPSSHPRQTPLRAVAETFSDSMRWSPTPGSASSRCRHSTTDPADPAARTAPRSVPPGVVRQPRPRIRAPGPREPEARHCRRQGPFHDLRPATPRPATISAGLLESTGAYGTNRSPLPRHLHPRVGEKPSGARGTEAPPSGHRAVPSRRPEHARAASATPVPARSRPRRPPPDHPATSAMTPPTRTPAATRPSAEWAEQYSARPGRRVRRTVRPGADSRSWPPQLAKVATDSSTRSPVASS